MAMRRRHWLLGGTGLLGGLLAGRVQSQSQPQAGASAPADTAAALLREGGCVLLLRHARTEPGVGDPPNFSLTQCSTQRNLSADGRTQAERLGAWLRSQGLRPQAVRTSMWCRCRDTATLAFGSATDWRALNSFFESRSNEPAQTRELRQTLQSVRAGTWEAWVTHQVNISALTGEFTAMGEALIVSASAEGVTIRGRFSIPG